MPLQRVHLARDFVEDVVDASEVLLGIFEAGFRQTLPRFELGDAGRLFNDGAAIGGLAAEDLTDAALLDDGVGLGPEAGAHKDVLNVAQTAELAVEQILALAGSEQATRNGDFAGLKSTLEFAAANLQHDMRSNCIVSDFGHSLRRIVFVSLARMNFLGVALNVVGLSRAHGRFVPIVVGEIVLNVNLGLKYVAVDFGIDEGERDLGHAGRLALARARENDVLHVDAAQQSRRLLAQHPRNGVGNVRLAAAVRTNNGGYAVALKA